MLVVIAPRPCAEFIALTRRLDAGCVVSVAPSFKIRQQLVAVALAVTFQPISGSMYYFTRQIALAEKFPSLALSFEPFDTHVLVHHPSAPECECRWLTDLLYFHLF